MPTRTPLPLRPATPTLTAEGWSFPALEDVTITNGTRVLSVHLPGRELVAVRLLLAAPLANEPRDGLFTVLSGLWGEGPAGTAGLAFATETESLGADIDGSALYNCLSLSLDVPSWHFAQALGLAVSTLVEPGYTTRSLERALRGHEAGYQHSLEEPSSLAGLESCRLTFAEGCRASRPFGGTPADLRGLSLDQLLAAHQRYVRPELATVVIAGDLRGEDPAALVEAALADWSPAISGSSSPLASPDLEPGQDPGARATVQRRSVGQTTLEWARCITGFGPRQWAALDLAISILAGGPTSRMTMRLREERGFTYGIHGAAGPWTPSTGLLAISTSVDAAATAGAIIETERLLADALESGFSVEERDQAVRYALGSAPIGMQSAAGVAGSLASVLSVGESPDAIDAARRILPDLSPDDLLDALRAAVPDGLLTLASVGPAAM